jgi:hypothetical protein
MTEPLSKTTQEPLTHARFAKIVSYMAKECSGWAGDCLTLPSLWNEPMKRESLLRFTADIRDRLSFLESLHTSD